MDEVEKGASENFAKRRRESSPFLSGPESHISSGLWSIKRGLVSPAEKHSNVYCVIFVYYVRDNRYWNSFSLLI